MLFYGIKIITIEEYAKVNLACKWLYLQFRASMPIFEVCPYLNNLMRKSSRVREFPRKRSFFVVKSELLPLFQQRRLL
jgi:hypothetical protein